MIAAGHALRLFEQFAAGRIPRQYMTNAEFDVNCLPLLNSPVPEVDRRCSACRFTGFWDAGINYLAQMLHT